MSCNGNVVQCNATQRNAMQCNAMQCNAMQCNAMQCNAMQCNAMQCNAMQCNIIQCNTVQYNAMQCNAMQCNFMQCNKLYVLLPCMCDLPVEAAIAPSRTAGNAMMIQPKAATYESICARKADLLDNTRWKYTCKTKWTRQKNTSLYIFAITIRFQFNDMICIHKYIYNK